MLTAEPSVLHLNMLRTTALEKKVRCDFLKWILLKTYFSIRVVILASLLFSAVPAQAGVFDWLLPNLNKGADFAADSKKGVSLSSYWCVPVEESFGGPQFLGGRLTVDRPNPERAATYFQVQAAVQGFEPPSTFIATAQQRRLLVGQLKLGNDSYVQRIGSEAKKLWREGSILNSAGKMSQLPFEPRGVVVDMNDWSRRYDHLSKISSQGLHAGLKNWFLEAFRYRAYFVVPEAFVKMESDVFEAQAFVRGGFLLGADNYRQNYHPFMSKTQEQAVRVECVKEGRGEYEEVLVKATAAAASSADQQSSEDSMERAEAFSSGSLLRDQTVAPAKEFPKVLALATALKIAHWIHYQEKTLLRPKGMGQSVALALAASMAYRIATLTRMRTAVNMVVPAEVLAALLLENSLSVEEWNHEIDFENLQEFSKLLLEVDGESGAQELLDDNPEYAQYLLEVGHKIKEFKSQQAAEACAKLGPMGCV